MLLDFYFCFILIFLSFIRQGGLGLINYIDKVKLNGMRNAHLLYLPCTFKTFKEVTGYRILKLTTPVLQKKVQFTVQ